MTVLPPCMCLFCMCAWYQCKVGAGSSGLGDIDSYVPPVGWGLNPDALKVTCSYRLSQPSISIDWN